LQTYVTDVNKEERVKEMAEVEKPEVSLLKEVDKTDAVVGDILTYTIYLTNDSLVAADNPIFQDVLPEELAFVAGSVKIDDIPDPSADPTVGFPVSSISIEGPIVITFEVEVVKPDPSGVITNTASADYEYESEPGEPPIKENATSNEVQTNVPAGRSACEWARDLIIHSVVQEQKAVAGVIDMEGEKIQAAAQLFRAGMLSVSDLLAINQSATDAIKSIAQLEEVLIQKLDQSKDICCGCS
jgi:uncharacterized repeat protein (TIGR01451 family)